MRKFSYRPSPLIHEFEIIELISIVATASDICKNRWLAEISGHININSHSSWSSKIWKSHRSNGAIAIRAKCLLRATWDKVTL